MVSSRRLWFPLRVRLLIPALLIPTLCIQVLSAQAATAGAQSSPSGSHAAQKAGDVGRANSLLDPGAVSNGVYRNKTLGLACTIPAGWVMRTEEMNEKEGNTAREKAPEENPHIAQNREDVGHPTDGRVLLAAFSRPPEARGEEVNASIVIAAESVATYPGLTEAVQYFGPLTEVATAQGFATDEDPYEIAIGPKTLVREDFHKNVGTRVMRQSTLVMLARGYAVSITVIGGSEDEVEELVDALDFQGSARVPPTAPK